MSNINYPHWVLLCLSIIIISHSCSKEEVINTETMSPPPPPPEVEICENDASTEYLLSVRNLNHDGVGLNYISHPNNHVLDVCRDHFSSTLTSGQALDEAIYEINRIEGCELNFVRKMGDVDHKSPFDLYPANPTTSHIDYVDLNDTLPERCGLPNNQNFAMRCCRYHKDSFNGTVNFNVMVNSNSYQQFEDYEHSNHPQKHGLLHELAHAFGMNHTPFWNVADRYYISTMQGNLEYLSAADVDYLRHKYPSEMKDHRNYVASSLTRFDGVKGKFEDMNPRFLYVNPDGFIKDCNSMEDPSFAAAWFNTGNLASENEVCGFNKLYLQDNEGNQILLHEWKIATMPYISQDQWQGQIAIQIENIETINFNNDWELVFEVNTDANLQEITREDNKFSMQIILTNGSC